MAAKTRNALCVGAVVLTIAITAFIIFGQPDTPAPATIHIDIAESAEAMALGAHFADFGTETPSSDARQIADWVADSRDNAGADFFIVDKNYARVYVFDAKARLRGAAPVLLGAALGDHSVPGIAARPIDQVRPAERTTPAGRFLAERGRNSFGEDVVWVDYDAAVSMHRVRTANPKERRLERLATPTVDDNRISYGCINVPVAFYEEYIGPTVALHRAVIYVLPDFDSAQRLFGSYDVASVHGLISNHSTSAACSESACAGAQSRVAARWRAVPHSDKKS